MKAKLLLIVGLLLGGVLSEASALPKNIIIMRHTEKIRGKPYLSLKGYERANALSYYFSGTPLYNNPPITHIFAAAVKEDSIRPVQSCTPIAQHYHLPVNSKFKSNETTEIAREILSSPKYADSTILICWSHIPIRSLVLALGGEDPGFWQEDIFDQIYMLTYDGKPKPRLQKILQKLMFGDRISF